MTNYTTDSFIEKVKSIFGDKYDYSKIKYTRAQDYVTIICPIHGEFEIKAYHLLNGVGCRKCALDQIKQRLAFTKNKFRFNSKI